MIGKIHEAIINRLKNKQETVIFPMFFENEPIEETDGKFLRVSVAHDGFRTLTPGTAPMMEACGRVIIAIHAPPNTGMSETNVLCDRIEAIFRPQLDGVEFAKPQIEVLGIDKEGKSYVTNMVVHYSRTFHEKTSWSQKEDDFE